MASSASSPLPLVLRLPDLVGTGELQATQEVHIFLAPLNPDDETVKRYEAAVESHNFQCDHSGVKDVYHIGDMKPCHLALVFRNSDGSDKTVRVMQSAQYVYSNSTMAVVDWALETKAYFERNGFPVLRVKIEASAYGIKGVPENATEVQKIESSRSAEEAKTLSNYFEFHISVRRKNAEEHGPLRDDELATLKTLSAAQSAKFGVPVPLSYNQSKIGSDDGHQRFLNVRFRNSGIDEIKSRLAEIKKSIEAPETPFNVRKIISEYVWYDTMSEMDHGWIDFTPAEWAALSAA